MQSVYFVNEHYKPGFSTHTILSIRCATDGFSFCIHNSSGELLLLKHESLFLESPEAMYAAAGEYINTDPWLKEKHSKVLVMVCDRKKTLIPAPLYQAETLPAYCALTMEVSPDDQPLPSFMEEIQYQFISGIPSAFLQLMQKKYPGCIVINSAFPFIRQSCTAIDNKFPCLFADIQDGYFDLLVLKDHTPLFFNSFRFRSETDMVYFILNVLKNLSLEPSAIQLYFSGNLKQSGKNHSLLRTYFPAFVSLPAETGPALQKHRIDPTFFYHLLNLYKCEL